MHSLKKGISFFLSAFILAGCYNSGDVEATRSAHYRDSAKVEGVLEMLASDTFSAKEIRQRLGGLSKDTFEIYDGSSDLTANGLMIHAKDRSDYTLFTGSQQFSALKKYEYEGYKIWKDGSDKGAPRYAIEPHPTLGKVLTVRY